MQFTKTKSTEAKLVLPIELVEPLYGLILRFNFAPTKVGSQFSHYRFLSNPNHRLLSPIKGLSLPLFGCWETSFG